MVMVQRDDAPIKRGFKLSFELRNMNILGSNNEERLKSIRTFFSLVKGLKSSF